MNTRHENRKAVLRMQEHIEEHLNQPITLTNLARVGCYSPYYAARIFKELTGKTPFEYIRLRRLSAAAQRLRSNPVKIVDVAFDFVFDSHEGFTRAFSKQFGTTPSKYRRNKQPMSLFMPEQMRDYYLNTRKGEIPMNTDQTTNTVFVQILERPKRKMLIKRGTKATHYFEYVEEVGSKIWETLADIKNVLHEPMGLWLPEKLRRENTSPYVQGVEVDQDYSEDIPEGFELIDLEPCQMMVFQGQPFDDEDFEQAITSLWDVIDSYKPESVGYFWADDDAPRFQLEPHGYRGYIEGRPVRPLAKGNLAVD